MAALFGGALLERGDLPERLRRSALRGLWRGARRLYGAGESARLGVAAQLHQRGQARRP